MGAEQMHNLAHVATMRIVRCVKAWILLGSIAAALTGCVAPVPHDGERVGESSEPAHDANIEPTRPAIDQEDLIVEPPPAFACHAACDCPAPPPCFGPACVNHKCEFKQVFDGNLCDDGMCIAGVCVNIQQPE